MIKNNYNLLSYQAKFVDYLLAKKYGILSVKSYQSDLQHYLDWAVVRTLRPNSNLSEKNVLSAFVNSGALRQYFIECRINDAPSTIKRRIAALSSFFKLALSNEWLDSKPLDFLTDLAEEEGRALKNNSQILSDFALYLQKQGISKNTVRGYIADINEYLITN